MTRLLARGLLEREVPVKRRSAHTKRFGDHGHSPLPLAHHPRSVELLRGEQRRAAREATSSVRGGQPSAGALPDDLPLELGDRE